jgi:glutamine amidotransferase
MIAIAAYGVGNVRALAQIYERNGVPVTITDSPASLSEASHVILPGVGSFDWAMERLQRSGLRDTLDQIALVRRRPVLGVCVGMQMMMERSDEGTTPGLGWIPGEVRRMSAVSGDEPLPHMGWNDVTPDDGDALFRGLESNATFYFLHSYHVMPASGSMSIARAWYGGEFVCAIRQHHLAGVQFHPEKSHDWGVRLLLNFASS